MVQQNTINIGMLGAAKIGKMGIVDPCQKNARARLYAVAARNPKRAIEYTKKHGLEKVHQSYDAMLADPDIDAIYNPLPNSLHCEWTIKALQAGKHVLCEKPFSSNTKEAVEMQEAAHANNRVLMEAFHYRFHPLMKTLCDTLPKLGEIQFIETKMCVPMFVPGNIRFDYGLAGGATMDVGAYTINLTRLIAKAAGPDSLKKIPCVDRALPLLKSDKIDRAMKVDLSWENGTSAGLHYSLWSSSFLNLSVRIVGERGEIFVINPFLPHLWHRVTIKLAGKKEVFRVKGDATYDYQLSAFLDLINNGPEYQSDLSDAIENMMVIDRIYEKAGLPLRG